MADSDGSFSFSFYALLIVGVLAIIAFGYFFSKSQNTLNNIDNQSSTDITKDEQKAPDNIDVKIEESSMATIDEELLNMDDLDEDQKRSIAIQPEFLREKIERLDTNSPEYCTLLIKVFPNEEDTWYNFSVSEYFGVDIVKYYNEINYRIKEIETDGETNLSLNDLLYAKGVARVYYNNYIASCVK